MKDYVKKQLEMHASGAIAKCRSSAVPHKGLKGTFREIIMSDLLAPFLPPPISVGTGTIINGVEDWVRVCNQDDIIIFDSSLMPPLLVGSGQTGVFLFNSVLGRIEVKTKITNAELKKFVAASIDIVQANIENAELNTVMSNSFGFGGTNASLVMSRYQQ